jgi:hypothetical protein
MYLLVLYRAVTQNVQPARTFLLYTYMTCGLLARERARRRASARAERAIKKNWPEAQLRFFATTFQMGQTRRVPSGGPNPELKITATRRQSEKTSFFTCRNPKCATRKNVPAIYPWHVGYSLASELAGVQVLVRKGRLKKIGSKGHWDFLRPSSKWVKHDVCRVAVQTPTSKSPPPAVKVKKRRFWHTKNTPLLV